MKYILNLISIVALLFTDLNAQVQTSVNIPAKDEILELLKTNKVPALGLGVIENGQLQYAKVYGELKAGFPATDDAIFDVASITKTITTLVTLRLVKDGKWDLDQALYHYWVDPEVKDDPLHKKLNTRHVLNHQTGFVNWRWMHDSKKLTFDFEPGTQLGYSGEGFEYLRKALENKFELPFEYLCDSLVFQPYGMKDSRLVWDEEWTKGRFALQHDQEMKPYEGIKSDRVSAADNLLISVKDLTTLGVQVLAKNGIGEELFAAMSKVAVEMKPGLAMGMSWVVVPDLPNGEFGILNAGSDKGVNAMILLLPQSGRGVVLTTNGDNGRKLVFQLMAQMTDAGAEMVKRF